PAPERWRARGAGLSRGAGARTHPAGGLKFSWRTTEGEETVSINKSWAIACGALAITLATLAHGQPAAWPNKPVRLINPYAAGGGVDAFGRPIAAKLTQQLGQTFIVENMAGAGGTVGAAAAAKAPPD